MLRCCWTGIKEKVSGPSAHLTVYHLEGAGHVCAWVVVLLVIIRSQILL